jgi:hypothetical protein
VHPTVLVRSAAPVWVFSVGTRNELVPELARLRLGFIVSSEKGEGGISPGDGTPNSPNGGRVTCMGIVDGVPMGDWL